MLSAPLIAVALLVALPPPSASAGAGKDATPCPTIRSLPRDLLESATGEPLITMATEPGSSLRVGTAIARVEAPIEVVFGIVTDHDAFSRIFEQVHKSITLGAEGTRRIVYMDIDLPFPIANRHYEVELDQSRHGPPERPCYESRWQYLPGSGNIEDNHGRWELVGEGAHTWLAYVAFVDPGGRMPAWTVNWAARKALPLMVDSVRYEAQQRMRARTHHP